MPAPFRYVYNLTLVLKPVFSIFVVPPLRMVKQNFFTVSNPSLLLRANECTKSDKPFLQGVVLFCNLLNINYLIYCMYVSVTGIRAYHPIYTQSNWKKL